MGNTELRRIARERMRQIESDGGNVRWWIGTEPDPANRLQILITPKDAQKQRPHGDTTPFTVTDLLTGKPITLRRADCGLGCQCALEEVENLEAPCAGCGNSPQTCICGERAADLLFRARLYLVNNFGPNSEAGKEAINILAWAEYRVRHGFVKVEVQQ